ncbi:unnamed protein product [Dovyalis caffra]|uniref:Uncharacterized protein n=1 Tax=Dovyalis caffra TaxID=77055 RepID=A0AAV1SQG8_9ROSI|nr:unnamed protein product [Dovyalis caffra]
MEVGNSKEGDTGSPPRQRFYIELKPGETTIVSWKKLLKDAAANKANPSQSQNQTAAAATAAADVAVEPASVDTAQQEAQFALAVNNFMLCKLDYEIHPNDKENSMIGKSVISHLERDAVCVDE